MASHSSGVILIEIFWAPVLVRYSVSDIDFSFLISASSMSGLAARLALTAAPARIWACLSRGLFLRARFNFALRDATSWAYTFLAEGLYGSGLIPTDSFLALFARAFNLLEW